MKKYKGKELSMNKVKEIIRLKYQKGLSQRDISRSVFIGHCSLALPFVRTASWRIVGFIVRGCFFPGVLKHFVALDRIVSKRVAFLIEKGQPHFSLPLIEQGVVINAEFFREMKGGDTLAKTPQNQHQYAARVVSPLEKSAGKQIENLAALSASVIHYWSAIPFMRSLSGWDGMLLGATQTFWRQDIHQKLIAFFFMH